MCAQYDSYRRKKGNWWSKFEFELELEFEFKFEFGWELELEFDLTLYQLLRVI